MIKQTLFFTTPARLSLKNKQMLIELKGCDTVSSRPIEDIGFIVVENQAVTLTLPLLNELVRNNAAVVLCDETLLPSAMLMCLDSNTTQAESFRLQLGVGEPMKKQAWKQLVEAKIKNQAAMLRHAGKQGDLLKPHYQNVRSGDTDNREGAAARIYWGELFGKGFTRARDGGPPNNLLNYGYTILRAATARALAGSGLLPNFGIFHRNRYNAFPLADDVMEPYRPFVDRIVAGLHADGTSELDKDTKARLIRLLAADVRVGKVVRPLQIALSMTTASIVRFYKGGTRKLSLPAMD